MKTSFRTVFDRDLKKIKDRAVLRRVQEVIEEVEAAPDLGAISGLTKLSGYEDCFRIRVGAYRLGVVVVSDTVDFARRLLRREIYKHFP